MSLFLIFYCCYLISGKYLDVSLHDNPSEEMLLFKCLIVFVSNGNFVNGNLTRKPTEKGTKRVGSFCKTVYLYLFIISARKHLSENCLFFTNKGNSLKSYDMTKLEISFSRFVYH
jgi:hypothetical protein